MRYRRLERVPHSRRIMEGAGSAMQCCPFHPGAGPAKRTYLATFASPPRKKARRVEFLSDIGNGRMIQCFALIAWPSSQGRWA